MQIVRCPIIDKAILDARYEIMAQEDQAIFDALDYICGGMYDWAFYE